MPEFLPSCCLLVLFTLLPAVGQAQQTQSPAGQADAEIETGGAIEGGIDQDIRFEIRDEIEDELDDDNESVPEADPVEQPVVDSPEIEREPIPDLEPLGIVERSIVIVDDAQRAASERFGYFMGQVDGFFSNAGSDDDAVSNDSWARIRFDGLSATAEGFELDTSVKVRAVLPRTERKLKLLVSTEDDDEEEAINPDEAPQGNQGGSIALRFIRSARDSSDLNLDIGVRRREGRVQYFGRLNARFKLDLNDKWLVNAANSYWHYNKTGYLDSLSFDARRLLFNKEYIYFRTYTDFNWRNGQKGAAIGHTTGFYWFIDANRSLAVEVLANYNTALSEEILDRFRGHEYRVRWRHNIWRPWFFYEIWPSISYPSTDRYRQREGLLLRAEVMIGEIR